MRLLIREIRGRFFRTTKYEALWAPLAALLPPGATLALPTGMECQACTYINPADATSCGVCEGRELHPLGGEGEDGGVEARQEGEEGILEMLQEESLVAEGRLTLLTPVAPPPGPGEDAAAALRLLSALQALAPTEPAALQLARLFSASTAPLALMRRAFPGSHMEWLALLGCGSSRSSSMLERTPCSPHRLPSPLPYTPSVRSVILAPHTHTAQAAAAAPHCPADTFARALQRAERESGALEGGGGKEEEPGEEAHSCFLLY